MYPSVSKVKAGQDYTLQIEFDNGESGILDMKPYLDFGVFQKLKNVQTFQSAKIAFDTVEWDNGIDLDPEFVYEHCQKRVHVLNT
jgi:hypothetical protein